LREFLEKYGLRLLIITTACAVLISVLSFVSATSGFLQNAVGVLTYPFRSAVTAVATWVEDKQRYYKDYSDLIAENEALRERVAELERDARQAEADREENALLRELLELREQRRDLTFESAAVIDRESTNWTSALTLNRGTAHGVEKNDCVVSAEGDLVGVVSAVGYNWCTVLTVIDTDTELGARVFRTQEVAVSEGDLVIFTNAMQALADELMAVADMPPSNVLDQAAEIDRFCAAVDLEIGLNLVSRGSAFPGTKIRALSEAAGMVLGADGLFTRYDDAGRAQFSLQNFESTPFSPDALRNLTTHGLTFLLDVPRVDHGERVFMQMTEVAKRFADTLQGALVDDNRQPLSDSQLDHIRREFIGKPQATMASFGLAAGSPQALRLFS
jgi:hypothetical protein